MVRKFLSISFSTLLIVMLTINLIQFARVPLIDFEYLNANLGTDINPNGQYFGFQSLFNMFYDISHNSYVSSMMDKIVLTLRGILDCLLLGIPQSIQAGNMTELIFNILTGGLVPIVRLVNCIFSLYWNICGFSSAMLEFIGKLFEGAYNFSNNSDLSSWYEYWESQRSSLAIGFDLIKVLVR